MQQDARLSLLNAPKCSNIRHWQFLISFLSTSCLPEQACGTGTGEPEKEWEPEVTKALFSLDMIINNTQCLPNEAGAREGVWVGIGASFSCRNTFNHPNLELFSVSSPSPPSPFPTHPHPRDAVTPQNTWAERELNPPNHPWGGGSPWQGPGGVLGCRERTNPRGPSSGAGTSVGTRAHGHVCAPKKLPGGKRRAKKG